MRSSSVEAQLVMLGADALGDQPRVGELVAVAAVVAVVADRERLDRPRLPLREERGVRARVDAAREEDADRDVAHLAQAHRGAQLVEDALGEISSSEQPTSATASSHGSQ